MRPGHEYSNHAREIARRWGVRMVEDSGLAKDEAHAQPNMRAVVHAPIVDETSYIVSMHELGHLLHANGFVRDQIRPKTALEKVKLQLVEEEAAWDWAQANVLDGEWTAGMESVKRFAMKTYTDHRDALERGEPLDGFEFAIEQMFEQMFGGGPMRPMGPPPPPPVPHDPTAVQRRASAYRGIASSIVDRIKKGGS